MACTFIEDITSIVNKISSSLVIQSPYSVDKIIMVEVMLRASDIGSQFLIDTWIFGIDGTIQVSNRL